ATHLAGEPDRIAGQRDRAVSFWATRWREPEPPVLPGGGGTPTGEGIAVTANAPVPLGEDGVTRFEWLLAALHAVLWRYGNAEPVVSIDLSTRTDAVADAIGLFVNELPVTVAPSGDETLGVLDCGPAVRLADLPVPPPGERALLLYAWNDTAAEVPAGTIVDLFRAQASRTPDATAVEDTSRRLTYAELLAAADRLAGRLAA